MLLFKHCDKVGAITLVVGMGQHQTGSVEEWPEQFGCGHIEAKGGGLEGCILDGQSVQRLECGEQVVQAVMLIEHAFGASGGTRGINDVGEMSRLHRATGVGGRLCGNGWPIAIQADDLHISEGIFPLPPAGGGWEEGGGARSRLVLAPAEG